MKLFNRTNTTATPSTLDHEIDTLERVMAHYPVRRPPTFGAPTRCPDCGEWGMVDEVRGLTAWNHCYFCAARWAITVRALRAIDDRRRRTQLNDDGAATPPPWLLRPRSARPRVEVLGI